MSVTISTDQVLRLAPRAHLAYQKAFAAAAEALSPYGILDSALRLAHFLGQVCAETGGLRVIEEDLGYRAERLVVVFPKHFKSIEAAAPYARNPQKLAEKVYGGRMGNTKPGDGYRFRGRGPLQLTGRNNYATIGRRLGVDFEANPELVADPRYILVVPALFWRDAGCNALADRDDMKAVTKAINGGYIGLEHRAEWLKKWKAELGA